MRIGGPVCPDRLENRTCLETAAQVHTRLVPTVAERCLVPVLDYLAALPPELSATEALAELVVVAMQQLYGAGQVFPSLERIGELVHCSRETAKRTVRQLEERRRIAVDRDQQDDVGRQLSSSYRPLKAGVYGGVRMIPPLRKVTPDLKRETLRREKHSSSTHTRARPAAPQTAPAAAAQAAPSYTAERAAMGPELAALTRRFGDQAELDVLEVIAELGAGHPVAISEAFTRLSETADVRTPGALFRKLLTLAIAGRLGPRPGARTAEPPRAPSAGAGEGLPPRPRPKPRDDLRDERTALLTRLEYTRGDKARRVLEDQLERLNARIAERDASRAA